MKPWRYPQARRARESHVKAGDLVRFVQRTPSHFEFRNSVGLVVAQHCPQRPTSNANLEVAFGGQVVNVHPGWLEVIK